MDRAFAQAVLLGRKALHGECFTHDFKDLHRAAPNLRWRWIIEDGWKLILPAQPIETGGPELYLLPEDPHEEKNVAPSHPSRVRALGAQLDDWWPGNTP